MARKTVEGQQSLRSMLARSPEIQEVARQLASLALAQVEQEGPLGVRQGEQLRRALATAGEALGWTVAAGSGESVAAASKDVMAIAKSGARAMARDLVEELARKRTEPDQIGDTAASARKLSEDADAAYPAEITYSYTVRDASQGLITKTETLTVNDAREALSAAESIDRSIPGRTKLADLMILDLEQKQVRLDQSARGLSDFLKSSQNVLREVIVNLQ